MTSNKENLLSLYHDEINEKIYKKIYNKNIVQKNKTDYSKIVVRKPWGYEYVIFQNSKVAITILYLDKKQQTSMHCHPNKKTSLIVLDGEIDCIGFSKKYKRKMGQGVFIDKKVFHQSINNSNKNAILMEIETPNMKYDLLRYKDKYGRKKLGYEKSEHFSVNLNNYNLISLDSAKTYHNLTKKFGKSSITFFKIKTKNEFTNLINTFSNSIVTVLNGELEYKKKIYSSGCSFESLKLNQSLGECKIINKLLIVVTKKNDNEVKSSDLIIDTLQNQNINKAFIVPGDSNLHLLDSIGKKENFNYSIFKDEYHASFAALGYVKVKHYPCVIIASSGNSTLKLIEAICSAYIDSEPLIVISGQAIRGQNTSSYIRQLGNKSVNIVNIIKSITKYSIKINHENDLVYHLEKAIYLSKNNRPGPVWIDVPIDLLGKTLNEAKIHHFNANELITNLIFKNLKSKIKNVYQILNKSKRPVLLVGYGIRLSNSKSQILTLIKLLKIPVVTSRRGADLINSKNDYYFGRPGVYGNRYSNLIIQKSDLVISIGSRLSIPLVGRKSKDFAHKAEKIIIDIDENELEKKTISSNFKINCSADVFIDSMIEYKDKLKSYNSWIEKCNYIKKLISFNQEKYKHNIKINPYLFMKDLSKIIPDRSIIFMDGNTIMNYTMQSFDIKKNQRLITASGLDNEGFAMPASLGLSRHDCDNFIIVLCEESSIFNSLDNFNKIVENKIPIKIFALSGVKNIALKNSQKDFFGERFVGTQNDDFNKYLINSQPFSKIGIKHITIKGKNYKNQIKKIFATNKPYIISVEIDSNHKIQPKMGFTINYSGNWQPKSLGDMYPFLDKKLLDKLNMEK